MVSGVGGGSNWALQQIRNDEIQRQRAANQVEDLQKQQQIQQSEQTQQLQKEQQANAAPQDEDWAKIQAEYQELQTKLQFDPNQNYDWQFDQNNQLLTQQVDFNVSASLTKDLYNNVVNSVEELMKSMLALEEAQKGAETSSSFKQQDLEAQWQQEIIQEVIKLNANNIAELASQEQEQQARQSINQKAPVRKIEQSEETKNPRALRIDDPRQRFANMIPQNRPTETKPVEELKKSAEANKIQNNSLAFDLRARMMMGQQNLAAASVGAKQAVNNAQQTKPVQPTPKANNLQFNSDNLKKPVIHPNKDIKETTKAQETNDESVKMSLKYAQQTIANFSSFIGKAAQYGTDMNVNALVQFALRQAYLDGVETLVYVRDKVKTNIEGKKAIRNYLNDSRNELTRVKTAASKALTAKYNDWEKQSDDYKKSHPLSPKDSECEQWLKDEASKLLKGDYALVLDDSSNPPQMVKSSTKLDSVDALEDHIKKLEGDLASLGDDAQLLNSELQNSMQKQQQLITMMSNISKMLNDTAMAVIRKLN